MIGDASAATQSPRRFVGFPENRWEIGAGVLLFPVAVDRFT